MAEEMRERNERDARERQARLDRMREENEARNRAAQEKQAENLKRMKESQERNAARWKETTDNVSRVTTKVIDDNRERAERSYNEYQQRREMREQQRDAQEAADLEARRAAQSNDDTSGTTNSTEYSSSPRTDNRSYEGERFPETRIRLLTESEASGMSFARLRYAINEIYARHGADFGSKQELRRQFAQFEWYRPQPGLSYDSIENELSSVERANIELLAKYRDSKKGQ